MSHFGAYKHTETQRKPLRQMWRGKGEGRERWTHTFQTVTNAYRPATERRVSIRKYSDNQSRLHTDLGLCYVYVCTELKKINKKFSISVQMAVDTKFKLAGSKMYTVRKHVCVNCDGGNRSFTQLHMRRARWILLTVLKWILHVLSPVTSREAVTLKFPAFWQFQTNLHRPRAALPRRRADGAVRAACRGLSQGCICLKLTGPARKNLTPRRLAWEETAGGGRRKKKVRRENRERANMWFILPNVGRRCYLDICKTDRLTLALMVIEQLFVAVILPP